MLRLQSDERLIALIRRGNSAAFEVLVSRYHSRLLAFCRHLLGSKEDAEDVLQEVLAAAFNAILADERPINVRPWLYRIARNRSLNHLRRIQAIGVDSMDIHFSENGASTADKVYAREQFRMLVGDIQGLPETQRTALVLREMDALSYEQIAEAMDTTVPGVKSLLVRARISLADAAEARQLSCDEVRIELAEVAEGLIKRPTPLVRRHLRTCRRCASFQSSLKQTNKALAALLPIGPLAVLRQLLIAHIGHSAGTGSGATAAGAAGATGATGAGAGAGASGAAAVAGTAGGGAIGSAGGLISAGAGAVATKAAAGLAAAALVTAGAVEASHSTHPHHSSAVAAVATPASVYHPAVPIGEESGGAGLPTRAISHALLVTSAAKHHRHHPAATVKLTTAAAKTPNPALGASTLDAAGTKSKPATTKDRAAGGRTQTQTDPTVLSSPAATSPSLSPSSAPDTGGASPTSTSSTSSSTGGSASPSTTTTSTAPTTTTAPSSDPTASTTTTTSTTTTSTSPTTSTDPTTTSTSPTTSTDPTTTTAAGTTTTTTTTATGTDSGSTAPSTTTSA